jgi:hypothetical protein
MGTIRDDDIDGLEKDGDDDGVTGAPRSGVESGTAIAAGAIDLSVGVDGDDDEKDSTEGDGRCGNGNGGGGRVGSGGGDGDEDDDDECEGDGKEVLSSRRPARCLN